jgi:glyoxylase-like metal-dependent hydrolase (beta-lactamase superfamily II)
MDMIVEPGKVNERITLLGAPESCFYHLDGGREAVLIGGGMAYLAPRILPQIEAFAVDVKKITKLIVLHTHFDHCGLVPYLKKLWPWIKVAASEKGRSRLSDPRVTQTIAASNQMAIARAGLDEEATRLEFEFTGIEVQQALKEGDRLVCGDVAIDILEVPGHSSCSIAAYVPEERALFVSDAAGVHYKDFVFAAGNSNYDLYQKSLHRMAAYPVKTVLLEHYGAAVGEEARTLLAKAIEAAEITRASIEKTYRLTRDVSKTTEAISRFVLARSPDYFLDKEILSMVIAQMVKFIAKAQEEKEGIGRFS